MLPQELLAMIAAWVAILPSDTGSDAPWEPAPELRLSLDSALISHVPRERTGSVVVGDAKQRRTEMLALAATDRAWRAACSSLLSSVASANLRATSGQLLGTLAQAHNPRTLELFHRATSIWSLGQRTFERELEVLHAFAKSWGALTSLSLGRATAEHLPGLLAALPGGADQLKELRAFYPACPSRGFRPALGGCWDARCPDRVFRQALASCTCLRVLQLDGEPAGAGPSPVAADDDERSAPESDARLLEIVGGEMERLDHLALSGIRVDVTLMPRFSEEEPYKSTVALRSLSVLDSDGFDVFTTATVASSTSRLQHLALDSPYTPPAIKAFQLPRLHTLRYTAFAEEASLKLLLTTAKGVKRLQVQQGLEATVQASGFAGTLRVVGK